MDLPFFGNNDITRNHRNGIALVVDLIVTLTRQNRPSVLPTGVGVWRNGLSWLDMPCHDDGVLRFGDNRAYWLTAGYLHIVT